MNDCIVVDDCLSWLVYVEETVCSIHWIPSLGDVSVSANVSAGGDSSIGVQAAEGVCC